MTTPLDLAPVRLTRPVRRGAARPGFTLVEALVVFFVIALLAAILLPALSSVFRTGVQTKSIGNMRQIGTFLEQYSQNNKERVCPSQFDYSGSEYDDSFRGGVRSRIGGVGNEHQGTWTDILWYENELATFPTTDAGGMDIAEAYIYDSPDRDFYRTIAPQVEFDDDDNPLRSAGINTRDAAGGNRPLPFGTGAVEEGLPGFFAANDYFDQTNPTPDARTKFGLWSITLIRQPSASMYATDSYFGEVIAPVEEPYELASDGAMLDTTQLDMKRYSGSILMLMMDGSVQRQGNFSDLETLEEGLASGAAVRIRGLADRK